MTGVTAIRFTQDQARSLTGASVESIRHWRNTINYLRNKVGKSARFTFTEVLGLAVTRELILFGVRIASIAEGVEALFQLLVQLGPGALEEGILLLTQTGASIVSSEEFTGLHLDQSGFVIPLQPLIARIRERMAPTRSVASDQASLPFPPKIARHGQ